MSGFLTSFFSGFLGWMKNAAKWLWMIVSNPDSSKFTLWLENNWLKCVVLVCVLGVAVDWAVNLARWRPDKVYSSFFRRIFHRNFRNSRQKGKIKEEKAEQLEKPFFSNADPEKKAGRLWRNLKETISADKEDDFSYHPVSTGGNPEEAYNSPYVPPRWNDEDNKEDNR